MAPDKITISKSVALCRSLGESAFLEMFASGRHPHSYYLEYEDAYFPLKAIWAAAHRPPIHNRDFTTQEARAGLARLGFTKVVQTLPDNVGVAPRAGST